ncbi:hypothetical protein SCATT_45860 [Streptantibioticus cattleyicolor NRRL 8057 = DSM 46488]|uniref:Uncharacterized protein n=1 Tax=Streptantibioticus cattleyicolor (strain ATCC 35852 / DSM 46488 / JCM 4925 / NBRC 14057 / NRRL 8057) TaxID=1003195 RepID=G8X0P2_STREN|nr:hypothetical protein SCATT_45860 [Streptantibioticus cattleyicolor NRRL 8057 = DSM 46488]
MDGHRTPRTARCGRRPGWPPALRTVDRAPATARAGRPRGSAAAGGAGPWRPGTAAPEGRTPRPGPPRPAPPAGTGHPLRPAVTPAVPCASRRARPGGPGPRHRGSGRKHHACPGTSCLSSGRRL